MTTVECSDAYSSDDEFELSLSPLSSLEGASTSAAGVVNDRLSNQEELGAAAASSEEEESFEQHTSEERSQTTAASNESGDYDGDAAAAASNESCEDGAEAPNESCDVDGAGEAANQSGDDRDEVCQEPSPSTGPPVETAAEIVGGQEEGSTCPSTRPPVETAAETVGGQAEGYTALPSETRMVNESVVLSCRTPKQEYLDLKQKVQTAWKSANALAEQRHEEDLRVKEQGQQAKESWHTRIHRRPTETELHRKVAGKTAQSIIDAALNREAWAKGRVCARARVSARERAFSAALDSLISRASEKEKLAADAEHRKAAEKAAASSTVWQAARFGVPVRRLQELMEQETEESRHTNPSEPFEQLCRRVHGVVVESKHPYPKGIRQEFEACVLGADHFFVAFDAASNATMGTGKVALREPNAEEPAVFSPRGAYHSSNPDKARLPGVNGEPPKRVEGSSVLVTFSASYWRGVAPAGEDYGWRLVCFTAGGDATSDDAKSLILDAERAADRAQAVDAVNVLGETCLHVACYEGNLDAVRYLLSVDADPNSAHIAGGGNTPLHEAARGGSLGATLLLLKSSANVIAANSHGDLPLHVACRRGRVDIARRLLAHDRDWATVSARNHAGLRASDVAHGCAALSSLLEQVLHTSSIAAEAAAAGRGDNDGERTAPAPVAAGSAGSRPGTITTTTTSDRVSNDTRRINKKRRGGRNAPPGSNGWPRRRERQRQQQHRGNGVIDHNSRPLLSASTLPRLARLPRPLDGGRSSSRFAVVGVGESETASIAACSGASGTSYGASLAESDFALPEASPDAEGGGGRQQRNESVVRV